MMMMMSGLLLRQCESAGAVVLQGGGRAMRGPFVVARNALACAAAPQIRRSSSKSEELAAVLGEIRPRSSATNKLWRARNSLTKENATKPSQVLTKTMADSYIEVHLPFSTDKQLQEEYLTYAGSIRVGKILEDLDALAGTIAYRHCDDNDPTTVPLTIVTASVDRITMLRRLPPNRDYRMHGHVSYVGTSSMEISVAVDTPKDEDPEQHEKVLMASFTMVARDPVTRTAYPVNKLKTTTPEEEEIFKRGEENKKTRKSEQAKSLHRQPPTEEERLIVHDLYLKTKDYVEGSLPPDAIWMSTTKRQSMRMCHPIERNIHNSIFGGFIMREAFEIGWMTAVLTVKGHPTLLAVDDISFSHPVEIGSLLTFSSRVTYAPAGGSRALQVDVQAEVVSPTTGQSKVTNTFHFTFSAPERTVPRVLPKTYEEAMWYLDGRRRYIKSKEECKQLCPDLFDSY